MIYVRPTAELAETGRDLQTDLRERIDVCICTFRRESVAAAIESVARQVLPPDITVRIIVADNDVEPSARERVAATAGRLRADVRYVHAPAGNISVARNACLAASDSGWFAFIDDDEVAAPDWLARLLAARGGADVVFGAALARYGRDAPDWMVRADFHSNVISGAKRVKTGHTCNVLIRRGCVEEVRFDPALGVAGGEDTVFFYELRLRGARLAAAPEAKVHETVTPERARLAWVLRRQFRSGQTHAHLTARFHPLQLAPTAALAAVKSAYSAVMAALLAPFPMRRMRNLARAVFHLGVVVRAAGGRFYAEYDTGAKRR